MSQSAAAAHIYQVQDDLPHQVKQETLRSFMTPAARSLRARIGSDNHAQLQTRSRGDSEDNNSLLTLDSEHSSKNKASDACSHATPSKPKTTNPANRSEPMQSPVATEKGNHVYRREHINSATSVTE